MSQKLFYGYLDNDARVQLDSDIVDIGDEYHTLHELYQHRMALNIALFNSLNELYGRCGLNLFVPKV